MSPPALMSPGVGSTSPMYAASGEGHLQGHSLLHVLATVASTLLNAKAVRLEAKAVLV